ncbi:hypothetical protein ANCCAN_14996 [Ancylostoma caninum]|uniref:Uncharacterized protein n=1 Tax=Ancylostoma caninum TaxID=29170 RepID=A0A368G3T1_ANCCA|nr:hypothetical protein ANCCAN_14996 [Ancylostoma caninum]
MAPFKSVSLKKLMDTWKQSSRVKEDQHAVCVVDFLRFYLLRVMILPLQATDPVEAVQSYACRQSGGWAKNENLKNIPEEIVSVIIDCLMEGFGIGQPELLMDADVLKEAPIRADIRGYKTANDELVPPTKRRALHPVGGD